jgi:hypothetical protein
MPRRSRSPLAQQRRPVTGLCQTAIGHRAWIGFTSTPCLGSIARVPRQGV